MDYEYITTKQQLKEAAKHWRRAKEIAVDLECENNLHHYGSYISLIQISTNKFHWVVDVIALKEIKPLLAMLRNPGVQKIFHDVSFDLRILRHQFGCKPKNVFDTELAAVFLGKKEIGLGYLLKEYFGIEKKKKFQMADWTRRPLTIEMLDYASQDTTHLIRLKRILQKELKDKKLFRWVSEEFRYIEDKDLNQRELTFKDVKGFSTLNDVQKTILKHLYNLREKLAKKLDMPHHFIMNNKLLMELSKSPPKNVAAWKKLRGVHPIIKGRAEQFYSVVKKAKENVEHMPNVKPKRYNQEQRNEFARLNDLREKISKKYKIFGHLIMNKDQMQCIVINKSYDCLRKWQKRLVLEFE